MSSTLVLDNTWRPLDFISAERAIVLCLMGKAQVIAHYENKVYRSQHLTINVPKVISLKVYVPLSEKATEKITRRILLARDDYTCQYCGTHTSQLKKGNILTKDHVKPVKNFPGKTREERLKNADTWDNVVISCSECNCLKGGRTPEEAGMVLKTVPIRPKGITIVLLSNAADEEQKKYITGKF